MFRAVKLAENAGFGFDKMKKGWLPYSGNEPIFESGVDFTRVTFNFPVNVKTSKNGGKKSSKEGGMISCKKSGKKDCEKNTFKSEIVITKKQQVVLNIIKRNPSITLEEVSNELNINVSAVQKHFDNLKKKKIIQRIGPDKGGHWKVLINLIDN